MTNKKLKVLSLFDGMSCGQIALDKLGFSAEKGNLEYYASEIKPYGIQVVQENYPQTTQVGDITKLEFKDGVLDNMEEEWEIGDVDLFIGGSPCFVAGTKVLTEKGGLQPIEQLKVGDRVLTHTGKYQEILKTGGDVKETVVLKAQGLLPTTTTMNHPYYVKTNKAAKPQWVEVKDIEKSNYIGVPILQKEGNPYNLTEEQAWLLGRYLADGHYRNEKREGRKNSYYYQVILSIGTYRLEEFKAQISENHYSCYQHSDGVHRVVFSSKEFVEFLKKHNFGKGAKNKRVPSVIFDLPKELAKKFLEGYFSGDGYKTKDDKQSFSSVSSELAQGINLLIAKVFNKPSNFYVYTPPKTTVIEGRTVNQSVIYKGEYSLIERKSHAFIENNIIWYPVRSIEPTGKKERVYNLEVANDNSYTANGAIVHNCQNFSAACIPNKRLGLQGEKSSLFYEYLRLLNEVKPKYFLLENVGSMKKSDQEAISNYLGVEPIKINSKVVTAQLRNRLYWTNIPQATVIEEKDVKLNDILEFGYSDREKARALLQSDSRPLSDPLRMFHRYYSTGFLTLVFKSKEHYVACTTHYDNHFKGMSAKEIDKVRDDIDISVYEGIRLLTRNERERLQGVPEGYTISATENQAASLLGDGWTVPVIEHLFSGLFDSKE